MPANEAWYRRVPHPSPEGVALQLALPSLGDAGGSADAVQLRLVELAKAADWPVSDAGGLEVRAELADLYGARWAERVGYAADVRWDVHRDGASVFDVLTRAFHEGPLQPGSAEALFGTAFYELLAQDGFAAVAAGGSGTAVPDPEITRVDVHELCWYRTTHPDARPLTLDVGGFVFPVAVATYGCMPLPTGTRIASPTGRGTVVMADVDLLLRIDDSDVPGQTVITAADPAVFEKLKAKGKISREP
jgi:hypothetical protein